MPNVSPGMSIEDKRYQIGGFALRSYTIFRNNSKWHSYLYSLYQKKQRLELELQEETCDTGLSKVAHPHESAQFVRLLGKDHFQNRFEGVALGVPSHTSYLGPGNSARLIERLVNGAVHWHISNNVQIPKQLHSDVPTRTTDIQGLKTMVTFPVVSDHRKLELSSFVPPSTQRAMIEHYLEIISPEFTFLPIEAESTLTLHENPLKWVSSNKGSPGAWAFNIVFAISAALITRDLEPNLSSVSMRCVEDVQKLSQSYLSLADPLENARWVCTAIFALALCELVVPTSGQLWELLGRAVTTLKELREGYKLRDRILDTDFDRLEHSILKLER